VFGYSPVDLQSRYEPPAVGPASITTMLANLDRQHTKVVRADGSEIAIGYDPTSGRRVSHSFPDLPGGPAKSLAYAYVAATGALQSITTSQGDGVAVTFDGSLVTSSTATGVAPGTVSMTYNSDFQLASETVAGDAVTVDYDDDGLTTRIGSLTFTRDPATGDVDGSTLGRGHGGARAHQLRRAAELVCAGHGRQRPEPDLAPGRRGAGTQTHPRRRSVAAPEPREPDREHPTIEAEGMIYGGRRYRAEARLAGRLYGLPFGVDVAAGDAITVAPDIVEGSRLLAFVGVEPVRLRVYPREPHVAPRKFLEAALERAKSLGIKVQEPKESKKR
jgi:hypothetical protein